MQHVIFSYWNMFVGVIKKASQMNPTLMSMMSLSHLLLQAHGADSPEGGRGEQPGCFQGGESPCTTVATHAYYYTSTSTQTMTLPLVMITHDNFLHQVTPV